jgi:hypothetical protein
MCSFLIVLFNNKIACKSTDIPKLPEEAPFARLTTSYVSRISLTSFLQPGIVDTSAPVVMTKDGSSMLFIFSIGATTLSGSRLLAFSMHWSKG